MRDSSSVGERETIKVPKSMVRVHPVSLLFLQKGESGCLSNNLTYYYAIRIRWMRGFHSVGNGRKSLKNRAIRYGLLMSWKDTSSVDFIQKKSGTVEDFIIFVGDFRRMMNQFSKINPDNNFMFSVAVDISTDVLDLLHAMK